eukprot:CAMPEP_0179007976 /NCGR_PEP_ID=MMETSP0795-20121207/15453_1 /TAXON_ID=88552 /ORGANISM="Amoebophrya sp., Strain Ameob2" /LENGTH=124 /DNA_ID=CAMNT_0020702997 /DNA_START=716 /DNA_END=1086 /DNA_ORIENTATION=+
MLLRSRRRGRSGWKQCGTSPVLYLPPDAHDFKQVASKPSLAKSWEFWLQRPAVQAGSIPGPQYAQGSPLKATARDKNLRSSTAPVSPPSNRSNEIALVAVRSMMFLVVLGTETRKTERGQENKT